MHTQNKRPMVGFDVHTSSLRGSKEQQQLYLPKHGVYQVLSNLRTTSVPCSITDRSPGLK